MAIIRPAADISKGGWSASSGTDLFAMLDDAVRGDGDFIRSLAAPAFAYLVRDTFGASPQDGSRTLTGSSSVASGRASIPGSGSWKGVHYQAVTRQIGLAMLARLNFGDIQAGASAVSGVDQLAAAIGFFDSAAPADPASATIADSVGSFNAGSEAGGLAIGSMSPVPSAKQIGYDLIVIQRDTGAIFYAAANPTARNVGSRPVMRPLTITGVRSTATLYPGVYGREAGAAVDEVAVRVLSEYPNWYLTAHAADTLLGSGTLGGTAAEVGGTWASANVQRTSTGAQRTAAGTHSVLNPGVPSVLMSWELVLGSSYNIECRFRASSSTTYWRLWLRTTGWNMERVEGNNIVYSVSGPTTAGAAGTVARVVIQDTGSQIRFWTNGARMDNQGVINSTALNTSYAAGFAIGETASRVRRFEMHPHTMTLPVSLRLETPWAPAAIGSTPITEDFAGSGTMEGKTSTTGGLIWTRTTGTGTISRNGAGAARIDGTASGDTYYTAPYSTSYVDMLMNRTASGTSMSNAASFATVVVQNATDYLSCRSFLHSSQPGTTEFEVLAGPLSGGSLIVMRVATALEQVPGGTQNFRFVVDIPNGICVVYMGDEPVGEYRHSLTSITRVGWGVGTSDTGTLLNDFQLRI